MKQISKCYPLNLLKLSLKAQAINNMYSLDVFQIALDKRSINQFLLLWNIDLVKHLIISLLLLQYWATSQTVLSVGYLISSCWFWSFTVRQRAGDHYLICNLCLINPIKTHILAIEALFVYKDWQSNWTENTPFSHLYASITGMFIG